MDCIYWHFTTQEKYTGLHYMKVGRFFNDFIYDPVDASMDLGNGINIVETGESRLLLHVS